MDSERKRERGGSRFFVSLAFIYEDCEKEKKYEMNSKRDIEREEDRDSLPLSLSKVVSLSCFHV